MEKNRRNLIWISVLGLSVAVWFMLWFTSQDAKTQAPSETFIPPNRNARLAAVGKLKSLSPDLQAAFNADDDSFSPIPRPGDADWLSAHFEIGQTFEQYTRSHPNRPDSRHQLIYLQPLGDFSADASPDLERLTEFAEGFFQLPVKRLTAEPLEGLPIQSRPHAGGRQILSTDVLDWLKPRVPQDAYCLLAVTMTDLYPDPNWNFVFGQASLMDRVGVYSFARYRSGLTSAGNADQRQMLLRSAKVLAHETGHMFGIKHCIHFSCLMNGSNSLSETDRGPIHLCPACLRKLHSAKPFDVLSRYRQLERISAEVGWDKEAEWYGKRGDVVAGSN